MIGGAENIYSNSNDADKKNNNIKNIENVDGSDGSAIKNENKNILKKINEDSVELKMIGNFMLTTINRCLDYTKVCNGLKLVPKYDPIFLFETLMMPFRCMKEQKNKKLKIEFVALPNDICSHVITDQQWFFYLKDILYIILYYYITDQLLLL
jgi:hypothetical protein